jgi:hypothetical protein
MPVPIELAVKAPLVDGLPLNEPWETDGRPLRVAGTLELGVTLALLDPPPAPPPPPTALELGLALALELVLLLLVEVDEVLCGSARPTNSNAHRTLVELGSNMIDSADFASVFFTAGKSKILPKVRSKGSYTPEATIHYLTELIQI